jgi:hypothetical protein
LDQRPLLLVLLLALNPAAAARSEAAIPGTTSQTELTALLESLEDVFDEIEDDELAAPGPSFGKLESTLYRVMDLLDAGVRPISDEDDDGDWEGIEIEIAALGTARALAQDDPHAAVRLLERLRLHVARNASEVELAETLGLIDLVTAMYMASTGQRGAALALAESGLALSALEGGDNSEGDVELAGLRTLLGGDPHKIVAWLVEDAGLDTPWVLARYRRYRCGMAALSEAIMPQPTDILRAQGYHHAAAQAFLVADWRRLALGCDDLHAPDPIEAEAMLDGGGAPGSFREQWRAALATLRTAAPPFHVSMHGIALPLPVGFEDEEAGVHAFDFGAELADMLACGPLGRFIDASTSCEPLRHCRPPLPEPEPSSPSTR